MDAQDAYMSPTSLSRIKLQTWLGGSPTFRGMLVHWTQDSVPRVTWAGMPCSPGSTLDLAKLLIYQHLLGFYTKQVRALQGSTTSLLTFQSLREKLSFGFVSATFGCVRKQCIACSLKQSCLPVQRFPANRQEAAAGERRPGITAHNLTFYYLATFTEHSLALIHQCKKPANTLTWLERDFPAFYGVLL